MFLYDRAVENLGPALWKAAVREVAKKGLPEPLIIPSISPIPRAKAAPRSLMGSITIPWPGSLRDVADADQ